MLRECVWCLGIALAAGTASAQPYEINWFTIDGGGGTSTGGAYELSGTIGQPDATMTLSGGSFELTGGFWAISAAQPTRLCADQNNDGVVNGLDFGAWLGNFNAMSLVADVNQDGAVNGLDFGAWLNAFNQGAAGPTCNP